MYLNKNEKNLISKEIEIVEKQSSSELVALITQASSNYTKSNLIVSLIFTLIISIISMFYISKAIELLEIQFISFFIFYLLFFEFQKLLMLFVPKKYKRFKATKKAKEEFINQGLYDTQTKNAIMFFVSINEKYVEIITDKKIKEKIDDSYWQDIVNEFVKDIKNKQFSQGYLKAIKSSSKILIEKFPIQENDKNELPNEVIEI